MKELADVPDSAQPIRDLLNQGKNMTEIAEIYGCSYTTIHKCLKEDRMPKAKGHPKYTEAQKIEADKQRAIRREKKKKELAENPEEYNKKFQKKNWSLEKAESLKGGAMQSLERYCTATNEEISQLMANVVKWRELGQIAPVKTDEECAERLDAYFNYIIRTGEKPSMEKMALALGVTTRAVDYWRNGQKGSRARQAMINYAVQTLAAMDAELVNNNKIPQVTYIFRSKNFFGMRDQTEIVHHTDRKEIDAEELRQRIMGNVIIEDAQDADFVDVND